MTVLEHGNLFNLYAFSNPGGERPPILSDLTEEELTVLTLRLVRTLSYFADDTNALAARLTKAANTFEGIE